MSRATLSFEKCARSGRPYEPLTTAAKRLQRAQDGIIDVFRNSEDATRKMLAIMDEGSTGRAEPSE